MFSILHEIGWRSAVYCLLAGGVSLFSLVTLVRQTVKERRIHIQADLSHAIRAEYADQDDTDPVNVLHLPPARPHSLLWRYLLMAAHALVLIGSLYLGLPAMKSALYTHQAQVAFSQHDYEGAVKRYESALAASPYADHLMTQYQDSLAQRDAKGGEIGDMRRLVSLHPGSAGDHNDLGNVLMKRGEIDNAIKEYRQAIALKPDDPIVHNNLGNALTAARNYPEAIAELQEAIHIDPDQAATYYNLANTFIANNRTTEAIKYFHRAIERNPKLAAAYFNLAQVLAKQGKREEAIVAMDTFLQIAPTMPEFAGSVGKAKQQLDSWRNAH
jgi:tetratricopeptide (TPR) repeat protein